MQEAEEKLPLVLVVDDEPSQRKLFELIADALAVRIHVAPSCAAATKALETLTVDLILMDWRMPGVDGCLCTQRIREIQAQNNDFTPIVAITAHALSGHRERCMEAGMDDYLSKPFTLSELRQKIEQWVGKKSSQNPTSGIEV